jgi:NDP-sugar pyrophosphorylase family protein
MTTLHCADVHVAILAGGEGTRLRPLTTVFPKPLVPLADKPIIEILLRRLAAHRFRHVTLCTGYLAELITAVCGDGSNLGLAISYVREPERLGTAGPLALLDAPSDPFFVMNGDLLTTLDFEQMLQHHLQTGADATIAVKTRTVQIDFGVIETDGDGRFAQYREKPSFTYDVSMGAYVLSRRVLRHIERGSRMDMPSLITAIARSGGVVSCHRTDCYWLDIGRMEDYGLAQEQYAADPARFLGAGPP